MDGRNWDSAFWSELDEDEYWELLREEEEYRFGSFADEGYVDALDEASNQTEEA